jgi:AraC family transcriptional regulator of arabinose operon
MAWPEKGNWPGDYKPIIYDSVEIPPGATSFCAPPTPLQAGYFRQASLRHTFRPKGTQDWLLIFTLDGAGLYRFPGGEFCSRRWDVTLYRPGFFQDYQVAAPAAKWDLAFAHFMPRAEWGPWLMWPEIAPGLMQLALAGRDLRRRVERRMADVIRLSRSSLVHGTAFGQNALEEVLLWCDSINPRRMRTESDPRVRRVIDHLSTHPAEPFSEEKLVQLAGLSASRLRHLFLAQTGVSPGRFLEEQRLRRARELLALSRLTVGEISDELGFASPFYFSLRFKRRMGESPRAFRRRMINPPR